MGDMLPPPLGGRVNKPPASSSSSLRRRAAQAMASADRAGGLGAVGEERSGGLDDGGGSGGSASGGSLSAADEAVEGARRLSLDERPPLARPVQLRSWRDYWDERREVDVPGRGTFCVYSAGAGGAVVFCLHGGGYTALTWSLVARRLKDKYRVVALDLRGHGDTRTTDDRDFSTATMSTDVVEVWGALFGGGGGGGGVVAEGSSSSGGGGGGAPGRTPTLLVGHSMGGALAVWAAATKRIAGLDGVVVIDVVEGTALAALPHMTSVLASRPPSFASLEAACDWVVRSGTCKNRETAGVSFPSQLVQRGGNGAGGIAGGNAGGGAAAGSGAGAGSGGGGAGGAWTWRTPLEASRPFWDGWYRGLSAALLALPVPKMLLLAGTDRLDKALTIGQMQGRFQLVLMPKAGHAIQEDEPDKTAEHLAAFLHRFRVGEPPLKIPRAPPGVRPVLPVAAGPLFVREPAPPLPPPPPPSSPPPASASAAAAAAAATAAAGARPAAAPAAGGGDGGGGGS